MKRTQLSAALLAATLLPATVFAGEVEVLHWWTSGGEAKSVAELKKMMTAKGDNWKDFAVAGGGGDNAMTALKTRVVSGNPPTAAQIKGPAIQEWGAEGVLANIDAVAKAEGWDKQLPPVVSQVMKYKGQYVAAPVNVHRVNWLWVNPDAFKKAGAKVPTTWPEFFEAADKLQKAGIMPIAHGGQPWQDATLFESVALGVGGPAYYKKAFVQLDQATLAGPTTVKVFETLQRVKGYIDKGAAGRDWNLATAMVINGKAGMQFMGDWAKGEFTAAGKKPGKDFLCVAAPGTAGSFTFNIDSLAMFKQKDPAAQKAQADLAETVMSKNFQEVFNLNKGSIPARLDTPMDKFDDCAKKSKADLTAASKSGGLVPSFAHKMAMASATEGAMDDVISQFMNSSMSPKTATERLAKAGKVH
ncbi:MULTISPECIES: ABC transporter substrate-binding protein [Aquitalea]|uniref:Probable sugar-binding periplasmic protein n=1 Tax=Aquitalea magnusonii TaxID=332411 RepID=A0A318JXH3_9NEIS|nr:MULTISPECIES: ABC transporter substrate-binding protein [Aquitalea]PXX50041.1 carbohydrate ABC transporter substrate-binding protein (CUT1 family) [Aquitalea magnusonii]